MTDDKGLTREEMEAEDATALPDREAMSTLPIIPPILDLDANVDVALDVAAPIDAAVAANANAALPLDAAASANVLSPDAQAGAAATQTSVIGQSLDGEATATANQTSAIGQGEGDGDAVAIPPEPEPDPEPYPAVPPEEGTNG
jgi:hypothetical protein